MRFWNYITEFAIFRWLFSSHKHKKTSHNETASHWGDHDHSHIPSQHYANSQDASDEDDDMDDYSSMNNYSSMHDYDTMHDYDDMDDDF